MIEAIKTVKGTAVPLMINDIDTDRIIPARFLRCVTFDGIGEYAFIDERVDTAGKKTDFPLNKPEYKGASVIVSAANFGCGSSREHAPQSLKRAGFNAVIAESFAEIFFGNSLTIGLVCVTMSREDTLTLSKKVQASPNTEIIISLEDMTADFGGAKYKISMPETAKTALTNGTYDLLAELRKNQDKAEKLITASPY